jgi:hypothetical protein
VFNRIVAFPLFTSLPVNGLAYERQRIVTIKPTLVQTLRKTPTARRRVGQRAADVQHLDLRNAVFDVFAHPVAQLHTA